VGGAQRVIWSSHSLFELPNAHDSVDTISLTVSQRDVVAKLAFGQGEIVDVVVHERELTRQFLEFYRERLSFR